MYQIVTDYHASEENKQIVRRGISVFNNTILNDESKGFSVFLKDTQGNILGGVAGWLRRESVYVETLWLEESVRSLGYGTKLLRTVEEEAIKSGCRYSTLDTYSFQAEEFYIKNGYERIGEIKNYLCEHSKIFLRKKLRMCYEEN